MADTVSVARLLRPRSIAIVGAAPEPGSIGGNVLANLEKSGYLGEIHLVSRTRGEINGRACVRTIDDLPPGIDAMVLIIPETAVLDALAACVRRRAGSAVVFASGFAEMGDEGRAKQDQLAAIARDGGLILNGPNCVGLTNYVDRIPLTFDPFDDPAGDRGANRTGVALIAQSGGLTSHLRLALRAKGVPVTYAISTGNEAAVGVEDFLAHLIDDESTRVIALFIEQVRRPKVFLHLARRARTRRIPVVMMHPGRSRRARESTQSHTGALAGSHAAMTAVLEREGVLLVSTLDELIDVAALLARWPAPPSSGLAVLTNSGGFKAVVLDFCEEAGLGLPALSAEARAALGEILPPFAPIGNPLDLTTATMSQPAIYGQALQAILNDPGIGSVLLSVIPAAPAGQMKRFAALLPVMAAAEKPVVFAPFGDETPLSDDLVSAVRSAGVPLLRSADRAMRALARLDAYGRMMRDAAYGPDAAAAPVSSPIWRFPGHGAIPEYRAKTYLAAAGIPVPEGSLARTFDEAQAIARRIGYPVVLKAQSSALPHKTDAGGIILGISEDSALAVEWERLQENVGRSQPGIVLDGVLVEKMAVPGLEMILGARRDADWGPVLMIGLGGIWTEALGDTALVPADAGEPAILAAIRKLKGAVLLDGVRGAAPLDSGAVAETAATLGELIRSAPELEDIEINPLRVYAAGAGVLALDALMNLEKW